MRQTAALLFLSLLATQGASAQATSRFENVKVLPDTMSRDRLLNIMGGFTRALGVRCTYCHVGEEGRPLNPSDFPLDDKPTKRKAREMLRMVSAINGQFLTSLESRNTPPVAVQCATCHRGLAVPRTLQDVLLIAFDAGGLDSTVRLYRSLRARYYGSASYDFGEVPLTLVAEGVANRGRPADAERLYALNMGMHPESDFAKRQHGLSVVTMAYARGGADSGTATYRAVSHRYWPDGASEFFLNDVGYRLLAQGKVQEAIAAFALNVTLFPASGNVYDSLGEASALAGDTAKAIANYEQSLKLDPSNTNAVEKLKELRRGGR